MNCRVVIAVLVTGLSGLIAQVVLLRELLVSFNGNELTIGIVLANWVVLEALGVFIAGKYADRIKSHVELFIQLLVLFSLVFPCSIYLSRAYKPILGIPFGEGAGLSVIFLASLFIILPVSFSHGALFSLGCKAYFLKWRKDSASAIGRVYAWEASGVIIGGVVLTYLLIPVFSSFQIAFAISGINLITCFLLIKYILSQRRRYFILVSLFLLFWILLGAGLNHIERFSLAEKFSPGELLDYRNSVYGNIAVTAQGEQRVFFYNGTPVIVTPFADTQFIEDFGHLPLLLHPDPKRVLVIGAGAGGLIGEILKHPLQRLDYAELDPMLIDMLMERSGRLAISELADKRVKIANVDGRFFLRAARDPYDLILVGLSEPSDLSSNRFFTQEFFLLADKRLKQGGVLAFCLPGSSAYLGQELRNLNSSILAALRGVYAYVRVIPGERNIFLASDSSGILKDDVSLLMRRFNSRRVKAGLINSEYLSYRLDRRHSDWFKESLKGALGRPNLDLWPSAVFQQIVFWSRKFSGAGGKILSIAERLNLGIVCLIVFLFTLFFSQRGNKRMITVYAVATTGFFGMMATLLLIFSFQVFYGYLYHQIGLLISVFMAGITAGSIFITARLKKIKEPLSLLIGLEALIVIFSCFMAFLISGMKLSLDFLYMVFIALFFISGLFAGAEFPLASKLYLKEGVKVGHASGALYSADLIGGWLAGMLGGVVFLPVLGFFNTCIVMVVLKLSSLFLLRGRFLSL